VAMGPLRCLAMIRSASPLGAFIFNIRSVLDDLRKRTLVDVNLL
jgi:hypothetical protein